jgi:hypothetical protein
MWAGFFIYLEIDGLFTISFFFSEAVACLNGTRG